MHLSTIAIIVLLIFSSCIKDQRGMQSISEPNVQQDVQTTINGDDIDYDTSQWREFTRETDGIIPDLRYATENNFTGGRLYECGRCFLSKRTGEALKKVVNHFHELGFKVVLYDCYRPLSIQRKLWEKWPNPNYVANPNKGSSHNRGISVDISLADSSGQYLNMGTPYDFFGVEAHHDYHKLPVDVIQNRRLLKNTMASHDFSSIRTEWWHYYYTGEYPALSDMIWNCN